MKTMIKLSLKNIKENKKWAFMTVIGISISLMLITMVMSFGIGTYRSVTKEYLSSSETWNVQLTSLDSGKPIYRKDIVEIEALLEKNPNIERYVTYTDIGVFEMANVHFGITVGNFELPTDSKDGNGRLSYSFDNVSEGRSPQNDKEIVISKDYGSTKLPSIGDDVQIKMNDGTFKSFTVVGYSKGHVNQVINQERLDGATTFIEYKDGIDYKEEMAKLDEIKVLDGRYHNELVNSIRGFAPPTNELFIAAVSLIALVVLVIALSSMSLIYNAFFLSLEQKVQQIGLLKSIGATNKQISIMVYFEGVFLTLISITLGIAGGYVLAHQSLEFIGMTYTNIAKELFRFKPVLTPELVVIIYVVGLLTVFFPIRKSVKYANKVSPVETIRNIHSNDDKLKLKKVPGFTERFLGLNGVLAFKNYYRDRKKHRSTGVALVITIVLFISVSSFLNYGRRAIDAGVNHSYDISFDIYIRDEDILREYNDIKERISLTLSPGSFVDYQATFLSGETKHKPFPFAEPFKKYDTGKFQMQFDQMLIILDDDFFIENFGEDNVNKTVMSNHQTGSIRVYDTNLNNSFRRIYVDDQFFAVKPGTEYDFSFTTGYDRENNTSISTVVDIPIDIIMHDIPLEIPKRSTDVVLNLFISKSRLKSLGIDKLLAEEGNGIFNNFKISTTEHDRVEKELREITLDNKYTHGNMLSYYVHNQTKDNLFIASAMGSLDVVSYILLGFITAICISNMMNVLQSSSRQRQKEFGIYRSVGMKTKDLRGMVFIESTLNSVIPLIFGVMGGIGVSYLMYFLLKKGLYLGPFELDVKAVLLSLALVFLIQSIQILSSISLLKRSNIVQDLKRMEM